MLVQRPRQSVVPPAGRSTRVQLTTASPLEFARVRVGQQTGAPIEIDNFTPCEVRLCIMIAEHEHVRQLPRPDGSRQALPSVTRKTLTV